VAECLSVSNVTTSPALIVVVSSAKSSILHCQQLLAIYALSIENDYFFSMYECKVPSSRRETQLMNEGKGMELPYCCAVLHPSFLLPVFLEVLSRRAKQTKGGATQRLYFVV